MSNRPKNQVKVWIAGASGFCGRAIVEALARRSELEVLPHLRPNSSRALMLRESWEDLPVELQVLGWPEVSAVIDRHQPDVIISCLGTTKRSARRGGGSYEEVDYGLNHQLIEAAASFDRPPHFIYISSMGVEWGRWSSYLGARMRVEDELMSSSMSYSILRPAILCGESRDERRPLEDIGAWLSFAMSALFERCGLQHKSDQVKPLDAPEIGRFVSALIPDRIDHPSEPAGSIYTVDQIHRILRQGG